MRILTFPGRREAAIRGPSQKQTRQSLSVRDPWAPAQSLLNRLGRGTPAALGLAMLLALASCGTEVGSYGRPPPLPATGQIVYNCADGTELAVTFANNQAQVAVVGGVSMVLPNIGTADAPHYSNGRYGVVGQGAQTQWEVGRRAPVTCRGG
ncbi:MAG: hypothetical protein ABUS48_01000 [Pseudomonadota bacterium]